MGTVREQLARFCDPSDELVEYFDNFPIADFSELPIGLLSLSEAIKTSEEFQDFHPQADYLGLLMLDDSNTSNYHAIATRGPMSGSIFHLSHDGESRFVFATLKHFAREVRLAFTQDVELRDRHPSVSVKARDQVALARALQELLDSEDDEARMVALIPCLDLTNRPLLEQLARHPNFYVAECIGDTIAHSPRADLLPIAQIVAEHEHVQAANAGKRAITAIGG